MLMRCTLCTVRIPKYRRNLICSVCRDIKHYRCQGLSKLDVENIHGASGYDWICHECISDALPINACSPSKTKSKLGKQNNNKNTEKKQKIFKVQCTSCSGYCLKESNIAVCYWCSSPNHNKCMKGQLGCINCCTSMIPGFFCNIYEIFDNFSAFTRNMLFNPYDPSLLTNQIGDSDFLNNENNIWSDIAEHLANCSYKIPGSIRESKNNEISVLSLNIRSVNRNLIKINDSIGDFEKFDVICLNETSCNLENLPNGINDLTIEGFHPPHVKNPVRVSNRGGGLLIYVNSRVCSADDIEDLEIDVDSTVDGEFQFVKIHNFKNSKRNVIFVNIYRSPAKSSRYFLEILDLALSKLSRHRKKLVVLLGDYNIDLLKHAQDEHSQALIDITTNHGFLQLISRPTRVTDHCATLIDHIYTNKVHSVVSTNVVTIDISDHLGTHVILSLDGNFDRSLRPNNRRNVRLQDIQRGK